VQTVFERHVRQCLWDTMGTQASVTHVLASRAGYQSWKCVFTKIDADKSGVLDAAEMSKALREVPIPCPVLTSWRA
jgi:Ca2+-binding EF-hand superfamily protein